MTEEETILRATILEELKKDYVLVRRPTDDIGLVGFDNYAFMTMLIDVVCAELEVDKEKVLSKTRATPYDDVRKIIYKLARKYGGRTMVFSFIAGFFKGNGNEPQKHSTVLWGARKADDLIQVDPKFREWYNKADNKIKEIINLKNQNND